MLSIILIACGKQNENLNENKNPNQNQTENEEENNEVKVDDVKYIYYDERNQFADNYYTERKYDFEKMKYYESSRDMYGKRYEDINLDLNSNKINNFFKQLNEIGFFKLEKEYDDNTETDGTSWDIIIEFKDNSQYKIYGYNQYPEQVDEIDDYFELYSGRTLFGSYPSVDRTNLNRLNSITIAVDGDNYGLPKLNPDYRKDKRLEDLYGIDEFTSTKLITSFSEVMQIYSILAGEEATIEEWVEAYEESQDYYWVFIARKVEYEHNIDVYYNFGYFDNDNSYDKITLLQINKNPWSELEYNKSCVDLLMVPKHYLEDINLNKSRLIVWHSY